LSGGRVDDACTSTADVTKNTFRQRHLTSNADGTFTTPGAQATLQPTCMLLAAPTGARCNCPAAGPPNALLVPVGLAPTFQVHFESMTQPGVVRAVSRGCSSIGKQCYAAVANDADAVAEVSVLLGLNSGLATPPSAALTVGKALDVSGGALALVNADVPTRGVTIDAGGAIVNDGNIRLSSVPGTPGSASVIANDPSLSVLTEDRVFVSQFGMDRDTYRTQPGAVQVTCSGDCATAIGTAVSQNPGRVIWVQGPATIDSAQVWGTAAVPVMLLMQGNLTVSANLQLFGVLHLQGAASTWSTTAGTTLVQGAVVAEGNLLVQGAPTVIFNPDVLRTINLTQGSMVRIPGSWRDFSVGG
jgi:hypothetical protein